MKEYKLNVRVGDLISVGRFRNVQTKIKAIETDENGQPVVYTSKGKKKLLSIVEDLLITLQLVDLTYLLVILILK